MHAQWFAIGSSLTVMIVVIELIRRQKMTFKYSLAWLFASSTALFLTFNQQMIVRLSAWAGFEVPSNFIFFLLMFLVILLSLLQTIHMNEQNSRGEILAQALARLEYQIKQLTDLRRKNSG